MNWEAPPFNEVSMVLMAAANIATTTSPIIVSGRRCRHTTA